jgi:CHAD domain-containing protein
MAKSVVKASRTPTAKAPASITLGGYALTLIKKQYHRLIKQEAGVLADVDPECLHQMRVSSRRLRTILQLFGSVVKLPKPAQAKQIQALAKVLGNLRDLDVQIAALRDHYRPLLSTAEQPATDQAIERLQDQRQTAFKQVERAFSDAKYRNLKSAYEDWLAQPVYYPLANLPLTAALPDLLAPLLSELLLHPGWWADRDADGQDTDDTVLHELRKTCKHARYQAEFFTDFYGKEFQQWVNELKQLQEDLGVVQDAHVLLELLDLRDQTTSPDLFQAIQQQRQGAMSGWDALRARYTDRPFRYSLYQMILTLA